MTEVVLALGSNMGNRIENLQMGLESLSSTPAFQVTKVSSIYETDAVGGPEQSDYLNMVIIGQTDISGPELLNLCHSIEDRAGRERIVRWGPRTLDVDIIAIADSVIQLPDLQVPHPRAYERGFVLIPWSEIAPDDNIPGRGSVRALAENFYDQGVRFFAEALSVHPSEAHK